MAETTVTINGREYQVACDDGQEAHLAKLARYVDKKVADLTASVGQIGDTRLLVMASLLIADELSDAYKQLEAFGAGREQGGHQADPEAMASALEACVKRIDDIAARLEHA